MDSIVKKSAYSLVSRVIGMVAQYALVLVLAKFYNKIEVGRFMLGRTVLRLTSVLSVFGLNNGIIPVIQKFQTNNQNSSVREVFLFSFGIVAVISLPLTIALWFGSDILADVVFHDAEFKSTLKIFALSVIPFSLFTITIATMRGMKRVVQFAILDNVLINLVIIAGVAYVCYEGMGVDICAWVVFVASAVSLVVALALLFPAFGRDGDRSSWSRWGVVKTSAPLMGTGVVVFLINWSDTLLLGWLGSIADVGVYVVASRVVMASQVVLYAFGSVIAPEIARCFHNNEMDAVKARFKKITVYMLLLTACFFSILFYFSHEILALFGSEYVVGVLPMYILSVGQIASLAVGPIAYVLTMTGLQNLEFKIRIVTMVINIIGNVALIPFFGLIGCAVATSFSLVFVNSLTSYYAYKCRGVSSFVFFNRA